MIIAHLSDLHLGYRAYGRATPQGMNQREADVSAAASHALERVVAIRPDLVVIAGDLFHSVRPSNASIADAFRKLSDLAKRLPGAAIILIAGDRDTPRSHDAATILELFREIPGISVACRRVERFHFPSFDTEVVAVPHAALGGVRGDLRPSSGPGRSVLLLHGMWPAEPGEIPLPGPAAEGGATIRATLFDSAEWSYVALGHHPTAVQLASNMWYAGSIERTSPDPWAEAETEKGFVRFDTESGESAFEAVPTRGVLDLPPVSARDLTPRQLNDAIREVVEGALDGVEGRIVRMTITDVSRTALKEVDRSLLRELRRATLHFVLDAHLPRRAAEAADLLRVRGLSLEQQVEDYLGRIWEPTMDGVSTERLVDLARSYLAQAEEGAER